MRIVVDYEACEGNAFCAAVAPDVFAVDEDDRLHLTAEVADGNADRVRQAVNACPKAALSLDGG